MQDKALSEQLDRYGEHSPLGVYWCDIFAANERGIWYALIFDHLARSVVPLLNLH